MHHAHCRSAGSRASAPSRSASRAAFASCSPLHTFNLFCGPLGCNLLRHNLLGSSLAGCGRVASNLSIRKLFGRNPFGCNLLARNLLAYGSGSRDLAGLFRSTLFGCSPGCAVEYRRLARVALGFPDHSSRRVSPTRNAHPPFCRCLQRHIGPLSQGGPRVAGSPCGFGQKPQVKRPTHQGATITSASDGYRSAALRRYFPRQRRPYGDRFLRPAKMP